MYDIMEPSGSLKNPTIAVGIDFGTTNSLIAAIVDGKCVVIPDARVLSFYPLLLHIALELR